MYHWRPRPVDELDAIEVGTIRTTSASLSHLPLITADHHGQGTGLRRRLENDCRARALVAEDRRSLFPARQRGGGDDAPMPAAPVGPAPTLVRPPALSDGHRRPVLGRGSAAVPGAGKRGPRSGAEAQRTVSGPGRADLSVRVPGLALRRQRGPHH